MQCRAAAALFGAFGVDCRREALAVQLGQHLPLKAILDEVQRERAQRAVRLLHPERDLAAVDGALLDRPLPFGVGTGGAGEVLALLRQIEQFPLTSRDMLDSG